MIMNKLKQIAIAILWSVSCLFCWQIGRDCGVDREAHDNKTPTKKELQTMLVNDGFDIGGDGVDGHIGPNSIAAWDLSDLEQIQDKFASQFDYFGTGRPK